MKDSYEYYEIKVTGGKEILHILGKRYKLERVVYVISRLSEDTGLWIAVTKNELFVPFENLPKDWEVRKVSKEENPEYFL